MKEKVFLNSILEAVNRRELKKKIIYYRMIYAEKMAMKTNDDYLRKNIFKFNLIKLQQEMGIYKKRYNWKNVHLDVELYLIKMKHVLYMKKFEKLYKKYCTFSKNENVKER